MNEKTSIVEAFYNNFLLRDLFAKIVPGFVVLITAVFQSPIEDKVVAMGEKIGWPLILMVSGVAWIVGFAIQKLGECCRFIKHHPSDYKNYEKRYETRIEFKRIASPSESQQVERYAIIKEAAGNGATAIFLVVLIFCCRFLTCYSPVLSRTELVFFILLIVFFIMLILVNHSHADKQYKYIESVIAKGEVSKWVR